MKKLPALYIILAGCLWGTMGLFVRRLNAMGLGSIEIVVMRCIVATIILFPVTMVKDRKLLVIKKKNILPLVASGWASILFFNYCYFSTISLMNLSAAAILLYTSPIFVMLLSLVFFKEKLTVRKILALLLAFGGCCLVSGIATSDTAITLQGLLLGLGSGLGYALYSIFSRVSLNQGLSSITITDYTFLFSAIGGVFLADLGAIGKVYGEYGLEFLGFAIFYTVVTTVLPYLLYTKGLSEVENGPASVMAAIEPVVATVLGFLVFSERLTVSAVLGILLVLLALILLNLSPKKKNEEI